MPNQTQNTDASYAYHGQYWMGKKHGIGRLEVTDGIVYVGEWFNDVPRGKGFLICGDGKY